MPGNSNNLRIQGDKTHIMLLGSRNDFEGEVLGSIAAYVYNDLITERRADYWEIYTKQGDLLAFRWFDRFGIPRTAVDRGIVEGKDKLEGIFINVTDGDSM